MAAKIFLTAMIWFFGTLFGGVLLVMNGWPRTGWAMLGLLGAFVAFSFAWERWNRLRTAAQGDAL